MSRLNDLIRFWLPALLTTAGLVLASRRLMHYFQLESYQFHGYTKTVLRQWKKAVAPCLALGLLWELLLFGCEKLLHSSSFFFQTIAVDWAGTLISLLLLCGAALAGGWLIRHFSTRHPEKKKFALTARMKRLYLVHALVLLGLQAFFFYGLQTRMGFGLLAMLLPLLVAFSALIALPIEKFIFHLYFRDAEKKLLENDRLIRIGITGSYGKTSVKFILATILSQKYNVLATPASFNTPMGVTRIIRERLTPSHQVFIGEMGARHVGEIKELARLVHPQIGVLTAVGPQHLDTFKTLERIEKTKYELIEALPADGFAVFLHDGGIVTKLYDRTEKPKCLAGRENGDVWAEDIRVSPAGSHFTLRLKGWEPIACETKLLGEHNIKNILLASAVSRHLGLTRDQIARGVAALQPVEHRLQLLRSAGGVTVIDDAFNTNPRSAKAALSVLASFSGRRVIVTPGMVELGAEEEKYNYEFGRAMAGSVDVAVLVGKKHTLPIAKGLLEAGFPQENLHVAASLGEAVALLNPMLRPGDVVMYENDLPDHYSEG